MKKLTLSALSTSFFVLASAQYTLVDLAEHSTPASCWTAVYGDVYDVTGYGPLHPDGPDTIWDMCGIDATALYDGEHIEHPQYLEIFPGIDLKGTFVDAEYTLLDLADHSTPNSCWTAVHGEVYDVTGYGPLHPDGPQTIWDMCGIDATELYDGEHLAHPQYLDIFPGIELLGIFVDDTLSNTTLYSNSTTGSITAMMNNTYDGLMAAGNDESEEPASVVSKNMPLVDIEEGYDFP